MLLDPKVMPRAQKHEKKMTTVVKNSRHSGRLGLKQVRTADTIGFALPFEKAETAIGSSSSESVKTVGTILVGPIPTGRRSDRLLQTPTLIRWWGHRTWTPCSVCLTNMMNVTIMTISVTTFSIMGAETVFDCFRVKNRVSELGTLVRTLIQTTSETLPLTLWVATRLFSYTRNTALFISAMIMSSWKNTFGLRVSLFVLRSMVRF